MVFAKIKKEQTKLYNQLRKYIDQARGERRGLRGFSGPFGEAMVPFLSGAAKR